MYQAVENALKRTGIVAIARHLAPEMALGMAQALRDGGIELMEVTMNTDGAAGMIRELKAAYGQEMHIGAGTVTTMERLDRALEAGAEFVVTPNLNADIVRRCVNEKILILPGVLTPSEICQAMDLGCQYMKLFPASVMGPAYLKAVLAALSEAKLLVVGGVSSDNLETYLQSGAKGAGIGGNLCRMRTEADAATVREEAHKLVELCRRYA